MRRLLNTSVWIVGVLIAVAVGVAATGFFENPIIKNSLGTMGVVTAENCDAAKVTKVVDGDTLQVQMDGKKQYVRLIGVDTPESVSSDETKNCEEGRIASNYTKSLVKVGSTVYLQRDVSDVDKYDRLLRYVWLEEPNGEVTKDSKMLNVILMREGYAQAMTIAPDVRYSVLFEELGQQAIKENKGVTKKWA